MSKYYMAYGSNMNIEDMKLRCPAAKVVGRRYLNGYRLMFNRYATIVEDKNSSVPVLIWEISDNDENQLDIYEGYPKLYHKETIKGFIEGEREEIMVYVMNEFVPTPPTKEYFCTILSAYRTFSFSDNYLKDALADTIMINDLPDNELRADFVNSYFQ